MATSNITLTLEVEHENDIPTASEITRMVAVLLAKPLTGRTGRVAGYGRVAYVDGLRVHLDSAAIVTGAGKPRPTHYAEFDENCGWSLMCLRYGEATATGLSYRSAQAEAKACESDPTRCGCRNTD